MPSKLPRVTITLLAFILLTITAKARAENEFRLDLAFGGQWRDAEKSSDNRNDDWLCWASTAANVLAWTRWGDTPNISSEDEIFAYYTQHWTDHPSGSPREAWRWWFNGINHGSGGAEVRVNGGDFWPEVEFPAENWECPSGSVFCGIGKNRLRRDPYILTKMLQQGYGMVLQIVRPTGNGERDSHMITLWGFRYDRWNRFKGILVTDSDDAKQFKKAESAENDLVYLPVKLVDGEWWFNYRGESWKILAAYGLLAKSMYQR